jgi:hypothetical protein
MRISMRISTLPVSFVIIEANPGVTFRGLLRNENVESSTLGENISSVEVTNIDARGLWLLMDDKEYYLPYDEFPWLVNATVRQITTIRCFPPDHLRWPELDVDLTLEMIEPPEMYPLKCQ